MHLIFKILLLYFWQSMAFALGTNFLLFPQNAQELALGRHAAVDGSEGVNPSLIKQKGSSPMFYINTGNFFGGINVSGLNYVQKIRNYNNRVFLKQADISGLEFRDSSPSDDPNSKFSAYALQLGTGISKKFTFGDLGFMFSYVSMGIYDQSSSGFSMDLGYSKLFKNGAGVGISILNLGYMSKLNNEKPKMPTEILIGFSKNIEIFRLKNKVYSTIEFLRNSSLINYKVGADINLSNYNIMTGYAISDNVSEFSIGGGLNYGRLEINYAVKFGSQEIGEPKIFSISYRMP